MHTKFLQDNSKGREHSGDFNVNWMDLKETRVRRLGLDSDGSGKGPVAESYERGNESSRSIQDEEFLD
jgi:hypothetical protein